MAPLRFMTVGKEGDIEMIKTVKLSGIVYAACDHLRIESTYSKSAGGYIIVCTPVEKEPFGFAMVFDSVYFALERNMHTLVCPATRRSAKKEVEVERMLEDAGKWANAFLERIGRKDIVVVGEVRE